jgi:hypothetical protein
MSRRALRLTLIAYAVKTALLGCVWLAAPDLFSRASAGARQAWERLTAP